MTTSSGRTKLFLQIQRADDRDVAIKMPLMKFVEDERGNAGVIFGSSIICRNKTPSVTKTDLRFRRRDIFKTDLITDFIAKSHTQFPGYTRGEHSRGEAARLKNDNLSVTSKPCFKSICGTCVDLPDRWVRKESIAGRI